ncbi:MAG: type 4a pilus biogenesis protein PilO [Planctomycetaceae bacterium]|nr:type 4a pilus biogenesis protein PilO [Planctomycetales bacterium]MCB9874429.1 type 4a pilus biogenesis protein PilO [Planctomycetaceae bacterium]MCB9941091.1 type 4a pilus biogenesis protein PilO [Planctomycetaceae bacterium]
MSTHTGKPSPRPNKPSSGVSEPVTHTAQPNTHVKKPKSLILTALISGTALVYAAFVFMPTQKSIAGIRAELASQRKEILELGSLENEIVDLERRISAVRATIETWEDHAPTPQEAATFIGVVSQLAQQAGANVGRITPRSVVKMSALRQHPADLAVDGNFGQIAEFLRLLEQRPETIWITRLNLTASGEAGANVRCELSFTVFTDNPGDSD